MSTTSDIKWKYKATWSAGSEYLRGFYYFNNKREAIKTIKAITLGYHRMGNEASWYVIDIVSDRVVACGRYDVCRHHSYINYPNAL